LHWFFLKPKGQRGASRWPFLILSNMKNFHVPIPTTYKGVQYRSRLEAKWAVFFDHLGFEFAYESNSVKDEHGNILYTPDFYIYDGFKAHDWVENFLIEIKPVPPNKEYLDRLAALPLPYTKEILIMVGEPSFSQKNGFWLYCWDPIPTPKFDWYKGFFLEQCNHCTRFNIATYNYNDIYCDCDTRYNSYPYAKKMALTYRFDLENQNS
jgi:hypothetical protein